MRQATSIKMMPVKAESMLRELKGNEEDADVNIWFLGKEKICL